MGVPEHTAQLQFGGGSPASRKLHCRLGWHLGIPAPGMSSHPPSWVLADPWLLTILTIECIMLRITYAPIDCPPFHSFLFPVYG